MSDSREGSPDWLRAFQAPNRDVVTLSSGSDSSPRNSPSRPTTTHDKAPKRHPENDDSIVIESGEDSQVKAKKAKNVKVENCPILVEDTLDTQEDGPAEVDIKEKSSDPPVSQRLPLIFPDKVQRSKALVECDGDSIDLSGDIGAVGRIVISDGPAGNQELLLDLKGTIYKSTIVPSRTFCVVSVGQSDAKIEAIMNDFIQLEPQSNVFEAETMIEGTLEGFSFDSDEEADKVPKSSGLQNDQNNENGDQPNNTKTKRKADKSSGPVHKKAKKVERPSTKKAVKKHQAVKRTKKSKK
ncbi:DNA-binding protein BIN4 [Ananas comosus]|uniref:DNA-binding protein BIN4 n=1 Tax=Ananas comosus TaxID=4615 RepID=A0A6P5F1G2_ANACO|nr:DNA-binding protein BIN4 [Ananas comosus]